MTTIPVDVVAALRVACVDEPWREALSRSLHVGVLLAGHGIDDVPLVFVHDLAFLLLRGSAVRLCGGRARVTDDNDNDDDTDHDLDDSLRAVRLRFEDRVLTPLLRDPSIHAVHVVVAGTAAARQDVVVAAAIAELVPRLQLSRRRQPIARWRALLDHLDDECDIAAVDVDLVATAAADLDDVTVEEGAAIGAAALWELARLDVLPSEAQRLALRTVHELSSSLPSPSSSLLTRLKDRRQQVAVDDDAADEFPAGGFDAMSTRGILENLVRSEVGYVGVGAEDDPKRPDLFDVRYVEGELLYYTRDESPLLERKRHLHIVVDEVERLRHKLVELPAQTLVLVQAVVLRAFADLQQHLAANAVGLTLELRGADDAIVAEEVALLSTSLAADIAHRRATVSSSSLSSSSSSMRVTFSPRPAPSAASSSSKKRTAQALWVRVGGASWTVTGSGDAALEVDPRTSLRDLVDLLMLRA